MKDNNTQERPIGWRDQTLELVQIGRSLATIEMILRDCRATAVTPDHLIRSHLNEAYTAARKLVDSLDCLRRHANDH